MSDLSPRETQIEMAYSKALEGVAMGLDRSLVSDIIAESRAGALMSIADVDSVMDKALDDALHSGIEREDIDPSWFARS